MCVCVCVRMRACVRACACVRARACVYVCARAHVCLIDIQGWHLYKGDFKNNVFKMTKLYILIPL